jgi:hypothetical protein
MPDTSFDVIRYENRAGAPLGDSPVGFMAFAYGKISNTAKKLSPVFARSPPQ